MQYYWRAFADPYTEPTKADTARKAVEMMKEDGVTKNIPEAESIRRMTYKWWNKEGYEEWQAEYWKELMKDKVAWLDKIGMLESRKDFRYWEALQMKFADFKRKQETSVNVHSNEILNEQESLLQRMRKQAKAEEDEKKEKTTNNKTGSKRSNKGSN
jgi:hypothetical protein